MASGKKTEHRQIDPDSDPLSGSIFWLNLDRMTFLDGR
jgi:hypothetical protein